ncbi:hypothetical protein [Haloarchaeobius salinus]|nr:hypothetical protein [Haloarchaeobius salinus]
MKNGFHRRDLRRHRAGGRLRSTKKDLNVIIMDGGHIVDEEGDDADD